MKIEELSERDLQEAVHHLISDPSVVRQTQSGKRIQILSPGRHNFHQGPDFLEVAIFLNGSVIVGDAEFHKNTSDWEKHKHSNDKNYKDVILHLVINDDSPIFDLNAELLIIKPDEIKKAWQELKDEIQKETDLSSIEDLQHFALLRLLRKTAEAQKLLRQFGLDSALSKLTEEFILKYFSRRKRPIYSSEDLKNIIKSIGKSSALKFLEELESGYCSYIADTLYRLLKEKISIEGAHLRRELILNCVLPLAISLANEEARISLFLWFWSTPSLHKYGILKRKYPDLPQNFLWQQQGMLEYMRLYGRKPNIVSEAIKDYGFAETLSFYRQGKSPFKEFE